MAQFTFQEFVNNSSLPPRMSSTSLVSRVMFRREVSSSLRSLAIQRISV